jgi:hypothetical protein
MEKRRRNYNVSDRRKRWEDSEVEDGVDGSILDPL